MPKQTIPGTTETYHLIAFDKDGKERTNDNHAPNDLYSNKVLAEAKADPPTNVFLFSHGWKGDMGGAIEQYNRWIKAMLDLTARKDKMGPAFKPLWIGVHWPSKPLGDESFAGDSFGGDAEGAEGPDADEVKKMAVDDFGGSPEVAAALDVIFKEQRDNAGALFMPDHVAEAYQTLAKSIGYVTDEAADGEQFDPAATFENVGESPFGVGSFFGKLLSPLMQLSYWQMKYRARSIGQGGMYRLVKTLQEQLPATTKFHLMGHSFGCVVVSSIVAGPDAKTPLPRPVNSLALVQGALSLWAYSDHIKNENSRDSGYFNKAFRTPGVSGPIIVTRSAHDKAVGVLYPLATSVVPIDAAGGFDGAIAPSFLPQIGGLGTFGLRGFEPLSDLLMKPATEDYAFEAGHVYNLKSDSFISGHSNIDGPQVANALWHAALQS